MSLARQPLLPLTGWEREARLRSLALARGLLSGVGEGPTLHHGGGCVLHVRQRLTAAEMKMVDHSCPGWCSIPAVDVAGGEALPASWRRLL